MKYLNIIPTIYLYNGKAVNKDTKEVIGDAVSFALSYDNNGADELLIFDISTTDREHEANISTMIKIADTVDIPMIVGGNVSRLEDVKKYIYTGAKKAILNVKENLQVLDEATKRFGSENLAIITDEDVPKDIDEKVSLVITSNKSLKTDNEVLFIGNSDDYNEFKNQYGLTTIDFNADFDFMSYKNKLKENNIKVNVFESALDFDSFKLNSNDMIPVVVQDYKTNKVLMVAYMNEEAFNNTIATGKMTYYSRSRNELWVKGETSGHFQYVKELYADCDKDTLLAKVRQVGVPCHTGADTCFFNELVKKEYDNTNPMNVFEDVFNVILDRKEHPKEGSYTNYLFDKGIDKILKKVGEEATEIVIAAKNPDPQEVKYEISDFLYHVMVLMAERGVTWSEITKELSRR